MGMGFVEMWAHMDARSVERAQRVHAVGLRASFCARHAQACDIDMHACCVLGLLCVGVLCLGSCLHE